MANIHILKNLSELTNLKWNVDVVTTTIIYGNQDIHIKSVEALAKATRSEKKLYMIIVDNKGDYDINTLMASEKVTSKSNWDIFFYRRRRRSRLERDAAYNHSSAIHEVFDVLQNSRLIASYPNFSPVVMLMDPDLLIIDENYFEFIEKNLEVYGVIGTRWTILKTHKFHCFPTPHLFITRLSTLRRLRLDYRSRPVARNISRFLFKFKPLEYFAMYNSYDPGSRMNKRDRLNILFIEQYYWKNEIYKARKKLRTLGVREGYLNLLPSNVGDESKFWIGRSYVSAIYFLSRLLLCRSNLVQILKKLIIVILNKENIRNNKNPRQKKIVNVEKISNFYRKTMLENINVKYFNDLNTDVIPKHHTSADVFYTEESKIFAIHGHMNSKARKKDNFLDYIQTNK